MCGADGLAVCPPHLFQNRARQEAAFHPNLKKRTHSQFVWQKSPPASIHVSIARFSPICGHPSYSLKNCYASKFSHLTEAAALAAEMPY
jgi:hypothetical protein